MLCYFSITFDFQSSFFNISYLCFIRVEITRNRHWVINYVENPELLVKNKPIPSWALSSLPL